jgi:hypothetical protein
MKLKQEFIFGNRLFVGGGCTLLVISSDCALRWHIVDTSGRVNIVDTELGGPSAWPESLSKARVRDLNHSPRPECLSVSVWRLCRLLQITIWLRYFSERQRPVIIPDILSLSSIWCFILNKFPLGNYENNCNKIKIICKLQQDIKIA